MNKNRLEAFSDGVIAILITIMVLSSRCRTARASSPCGPLLAVFSSYVLSFVYLRAIAYRILQQAVIAAQGEDSVLRRAVGRDWKGKVSPLLHALAMALAFGAQWGSIAIYVLVALVWLVPDRRIERAFAPAGQAPR